MRSSLLGRSFPCLAAVLGCGPNEPVVPPPPPDCTGPACTLRPGGGGTGSLTDAGGGFDAGDDGSDAARVSVAFAVRQTVDTWFWSAVPHGAAVTVNAAAASGRLAGSGDAGITPTGVLEGVEPGPNWFAVQDATFTRRIAPTLQLVIVDAMTATVDLRAIALDGLTTLIVDQVLWTPPAGTATLIVTFRRGGRGVTGVVVNGASLPSGASIAYDSTSGYVSDAMILGTLPATGVEGTAIVRQLPGVQQFPGLISLTLPYRLGTTNYPPVEAKVARDFITWMAVDIP